MTVVQEYSPDAFRKWTGQKLVVVATGEVISAPEVVGQMWVDSDLANVGLYRVQSFVPPAGKVSVGGPSWARVDGVVTETYAVEDAPPPSAEQVREGTFIANPNVADLLNKLDTASLDQIDAWLTANVIDLASARTVLGYVIKALVLIRRGH